MKQSELPIIFSKTHSVESPGTKVNSRGGNRKFISILALAEVTIKLLEF